MNDSGSGQTVADPHAEPLCVNEADGLHLPEEYIGHEGGLVVRLPNGGTIDFKPREWDGFVPNVLPRHFDETSDGTNNHLAQDEVGLKKYGADAEAYRVEVA